MREIELTLFYYGGPLMWVLLGISVIGSLLFLERLLFLHRGQVRTQQLLAGIENLLKKERLLEALTLCEGIPGPLPGVVKSILLKADKSEDEMKRAAVDSALVEIPTLERRLGSIAAIAKIGPLIGFLGTVLGVVNTFMGIGNSPISTGYPTFADFVGGVGQALLTTAFGLILAIMAHLGHYFLSSRVKALVYDMEFVAHSLIDFILQMRIESKAQSLESSESENQ